MLLDDDIAHELQEYVDRLSIEEARVVYKLIARRLNAIQHLHETALLQRFHVGDRVAFHSAGRHIEGLIVRVNLRTVSVTEDGGKRWTVAPQYLAPASEAVKTSNSVPRKSKTKKHRRKKR